MYIFYGQFFHFSDEAVKGARRRRGKPRLDQHMRSNLEAAMRASGRPRYALERLECRQTCFIMAPKTGSKKLVETWRPERDLDCTCLRLA